MIMTNICSYICVKCILYDLLLNCKYVAENMDIRTSEKTAITMAMGFLKGRKHNRNVLKSSLKFSQKYKRSLF